MAAFVVNVGADCSHPIAAGSRVSAEPFRNVRSTEVRRHEVPAHLLASATGNVAKRTGSDVNANDCDASVDVSWKPLSTLFGTATASIAPVSLQSAD